MNDEIDWREAARLLHMINPVMYSTVKLCRLLQKSRWLMQVALGGEERRSHRSAYFRQRRKDNLEEVRQKERNIQARLRQNPEYRARRCEAQKKYRERKRNDTASSAQH